MIKQPCIICGYHLKLCIRAPRVIIMLILLFMYLHGMLGPIIDFSRSVQIAPTPWFFPYLVNDHVAQMIITFGGIILFCDAPFHSSMEHYLLIRTNFRRWRAGQTLYVLSASFLYIAFIIVSTSIILILGTGMEFSMGWGKIWGTLVNTDAGMQFSVPMGFDMYVYSSYTPLEAFFFSFILEWGAIALFGLISYNLNRLRGYWGTILAAGLNLLDLAILNYLPFMFYSVSPVSLAKLSVLTGNSMTRAPSFTYAFLFFAITILIGSFAAIYLNKREGLK